MYPYASPWTLNPDNEGQQLHLVNDSHWVLPLKLSCNQHAPLRFTGLAYVKPRSIGKLCTGSLLVYCPTTIYLLLPTQPSLAPSVEHIHLQCQLARGNEELHFDSANIVYKTTFTVESYLFVAIGITVFKKHSRFDRNFDAFSQKVSDSRVLLVYLKTLSTT